MGEWGDMSFVTDDLDPDPFRHRRSELSWVLLDKSHHIFSQLPIDFPPKVVDVFNAIVLRGAFCKDIEHIVIEENFDTHAHPDNPISISVCHFGERIPLNKEGPQDELMSLINMVSNFPPSYYEIVVNDIGQDYNQVFKEADGKLTEMPCLYSGAGDGTNNWTRVTFRPNLRIFNISDDVLNVGRTIWKRTVDIAGTFGHINVTLNGTHLGYRSFAEYVDQVYPQFVLEKRQDTPKRVHEQLTKDDHRWEVSISRSNGQFEQVSFINGLPAHRGGPHVEFMKTTLNQYAVEVKKKHSVEFDPDDICLFINLIINDTLICSENDFHSIVFPYKLEFSPDFIENFTQILKGLGPVKLSENVPNLIDATEAGGEKAEQCYLILTEGESAKKFALTGHGRLGRQFYGLLPIRGKIPNAKRNGSNSLEHEEVKSIIASLGLEMGASYSSVKKLRYGHLMLMMDQDHDGSHIKGLVINLIHTFWPSLLKIDFLSQFVTPVIKVKRNKDYHEFYSLPEYNIWAKNHCDELGNVDGIPRYYKGLASHDPDDVKEYMTNKIRHVKTFKYSGPQDFNAINLAFSEARVCDRRQWIMTFEEGTFLDLTPESISYSDFFNKEFLLYSTEDIKRSIPSMIDGLKPSQRKALFTALKTNLVIQQVETLAGAVSKECVYHHGQFNMSETIVGMAQDRLGTNNINLFVPKGIFGIWPEAPKTSAARYLSVEMSPVTRNIFLEEDGALLSHRVEDGKQVQPDWFLPVIPMALVNGCEGIATGWSTKITKYSPLQIIKNLKNLLTGNQSKYEQLLPSFNGFKGKVERIEGSEGSYRVSAGLVIEPLKVEISEMPVEANYDKFKVELDMLKTEGKIKSYNEQHEDDNIKYVVAFTEEQFEAAGKQGFSELPKLVGTFTTDNMHLIDEKGLLTKYSSADEVLFDFYAFRLPFYRKRKNMLLGQYKETVKKLENKRRFIEDFNEDKFSKKSSERSNQLREFGYDPFDDFNYLLKLNLDDLDTDMLHGIDSECNSIKEDIMKLEGTTPSDLWMADLEALEHSLAGQITVDPAFRPRKKQRTGH